MSFATNDERTAKRVSDALGTATELRAMKNYAGHRLSPWLGHLMVSRQETARPLLTPGEVMQLPPTDEVVMVAGTPPIRAKKARYFEDAQFQARILEPPVSELSTEVRPDDWSAIPIPPRPDIADPKAQFDSGEDGEKEKRQQPELDRTQSIDESKPISNEFEPDLKEPSNDRAAQLGMFEQQARQIARQAALDPDDGIDI